MQIAPSELILNPDGSVYHLHLLPEHIATTIITVGDPDRVDIVSSFFDTIEYTVHKREFKTITGSYQNKRLTVISTGIGTDNIDIVLNELDALVNIDLITREVKTKHTSLDIIRIGTSGAIQADIPVDSFLLSKTAIGLDALLHFYQSQSIQRTDIQDAFVRYMQLHPTKSRPYVVDCNHALAGYFMGDMMLEGCTATNIGFYGPQGRTLRLSTSDETMNKKLRAFRFSQPGLQPGSSAITNLEMETSGIYGLAALLGHRAVSLNAILVNRVMGTSSIKPTETIHLLIKYTLERVVHI